jgi:hypothetical protein
MQIVTPEQYGEIQKDNEHLFDICMPTAQMIENDLEWFVRDGFDQAGTLLLGDLRVKKTSTKAVEIHPFPEWVIQMHLPGKKSGKVYVIIPKITQKLLKKIERRPWEKRLVKIQETLDTLTPDDYLAIEYVEGISIKVPANVPHDFIGVIKEGEEVPYCQVFEPNFSHIGELFKINTPYFDLKEELKVI